ncbi:MAG: LysR substrate-binding domain-containing protein [Promethearchaeota archaeon]
MIRLFDLKVFITVVEDRSFSRAGKRLGITQSSVTQVIQKLEENLGTSLINRSSKYFTLTPQGKIFYDAAKEIIDRFEQCKIDIRNYTENEQNKLRIVVSTTPGEYILPPFFSIFSHDYPNFRLLIEMTDSKRALELLKEEEYQIAVVGSLIDRLENKFEAVPLRKERLVLVASKSLKTPEAGSVPLKALLDMTRIDREAGSGTQHEAAVYLDKINKRLKELAQDFKPKVIQLQSVQAILSALSEGNNLWSIIGEFPAKKYANLGLIKIFEIEDLKFNAERVIYLVFNKQHISDAMKIFIDNIQHYFKAQLMTESWNLEK